MKKVTKKLQLNKTTISALNHQQLSQVQAGLLMPFYTFETFDTWCGGGDTFGGIPGTGGGPGSGGCPSPNPFPTISCATCNPANQTCMQGATNCGLHNTCSCESRCLCFPTQNGAATCNNCPQPSQVPALCPSGFPGCTNHPSLCPC